MCIPNTLQQNILEGTKGGYDIARFLAETMRGETLGVKVNHRLEAAKQLIKHGFQQDQPDINPPLPQDEDESAVQSPLSPGERVRVRGKEIAQPITHLDILNYQIAHLIRHETAEGHTIVNFLVDTMTGRDRPFTPRKFRIKPADRMAAARELLRRGFGDLGSRRKLSDTTDEANAYDTLHTDLAKRMREYNERGTDTIRFLLELMSDPDPDKEFTSITVCMQRRSYCAEAGTPTTTTSSLSTSRTTGKTRKARACQLARRRSRQACPSMLTVRHPMTMWTTKPSQEKSAKKRIEKKPPKYPPPSTRRSGQ